MLIKFITWFEMWYRSKYGHRAASNDLRFNEERGKYPHKIAQSQFEAFTAGVDYFIKNVKLGTVFEDDEGNKYIVVHEGVDYFGVYTNSPNFDKEYLEIKIAARFDFRVELKDVASGASFNATISMG